MTKRVKKEAEEEGGEEGGDAAGGGGGGGAVGEEGADLAAEEEGAAAEQEAEVEVSLGDEIALNRSLDTAVETQLIDFEAEALKAAKVGFEREQDLNVLAGEEMAIELEWYKVPLSKLLFEQEEVTAEEGEEEEVVAYEGPAMDMDNFTSNVARLVMNYDSLLDIELLIINKAKDFLRSRYDEDHVAKFEELLDIRYGLDIDAEKEEREIPLAVGATAAAGGGGGI